MAYTTLAKLYEHIKVLDVELNTDIPKAQGAGSYKGSMISGKNAKKETVDIKVAQSYLDNKYQSALKEAFSNVKAGDLITVVKHKTTKMSEDDFNKLSKDDQKTNSNWGVAAIYPGHIIPEDIAAEQRQNAVAAKVSQGYQKKNEVGIQVGHAINGAMRYTNGKITTDKLIEVGKAVHDITEAVKAKYKPANPEMSDYDIGAATGNAVLNALEIACAKKLELDSVEGIALKILSDVVPALKEYMAPEKEEEATPEPAQEIPEQESDGVEDQDEDDGLPF